MDSEILIKEVSGEYLEQVTIKREPLVLAYFSASWCQQCKVLGPILESVAMDMDGELTIVKVNLEISQEIAETYKIRSLPTMLVFKDGILINEAVGVMPKDKIKKLLLDTE